MEFDHFRSELSRRLRLNVWGAYEAGPGKYPSAFFVALHEPGPYCESMMIFDVPKKGLTEELLTDVERLLSQQALHHGMVMVH